MVYRGEFTQVGEPVKNRTKRTWCGDTGTHCVEGNAEHAKGKNPRNGSGTRLCGHLECLYYPLIILPGDMIDAGLVRARIATFKSAGDIRFCGRNPFNASDIKDDARLVILAAHNAPDGLFHSDAFGYRFNRRSLVTEALKER